MRYTNNEARIMRYQIFGSANPTTPIAEARSMCSCVDAAWETIKTDETQTFKIVDNDYGQFANVTYNRNGGPIGVTVCFFLPIV